VQHALEYFAAQRYRALSIAGAEWVLFVDADEGVTPELAAEVRQGLWAEARRARMAHRRGQLSAAELEKRLAAFEEVGRL